jgi:hypothetical protein
VPVLILTSQIWRAKKLRAKLAFLAVKEFSRADLPCGNVKPKADLPEATKPIKQSARVMREVLGELLVLLAVLSGFAGWSQHLYTCFNEKLWGFLIAGAIFFPLGIIHGICIWLGWWH